MLSAQRGAPAPLSISAQTTINKHFPKLLPKQFMKPSYIATTEEVGCLTELCCGDHFSEVEIFSLLEEQIPKYKIRSDHLTNFAGYSNQDWYTSAPTLTFGSEGLGLTKDQTRETLNYFLLCGNRVSQMTRVYDDIEAVTRLLEEKEKDLELTVQIGKELLSQNNSMEIKIYNLEADLRVCNEDRTQLLHELNKKIELIGLLTNDDDWSDNETSSTTKPVTFDLLNKKVSFLQEENKLLKVEAFQLATKTEEVEQLERKLMSDITTQLNEANMQNESLFLEIEQQREENRLLREQIINVTASLSETQKHLHQLTYHYEEQKILHNITKESQNSLALELTEVKQLYKEVFLLLQEAQEQLRNQRKKIMPNAKTSYIPVISVSHTESLHSELLESSVYSQNSLDSGIDGYNNQKMEIYGISYANRDLGTKYKKAFQTVRSTNKNVLICDSKHNNIDNISRSRMLSGPYLCNMISKTTEDNSPDNLVNQCSYNEQKYKNSFSCDSLAKRLGESASQMSGVPGAPGAKDLEDALKRLSPAEVFKKSPILSYYQKNAFDEVLYSYEEKTGIRTPDSIMSTGSYGVSSSPNMNTSLNQWRIPSKLKIIKPVEGSQTLNHWLKLATPTLSGLLEERPGVTIRGGRGLDELGIQVYTLSDLEEDIEENPGKQFEASGCIFTYTTSIIMHPDDSFINSSSYILRSRVSSNRGSSSTSCQRSCPPTPIASRRNSCSTFSVNLGLAAMLNERGIKAITPSALITTKSPDISPVLTPCNSPERNPKSPEFSQIASCSEHFTKIKFRYITEQSTQNQRTHQQIMLSRLTKRALNSLKLVEKVESIGLQNIISNPSKTMDTFSFDVSKFNSKELESLNSASSRTYESLYFDCNHLEGILNRGMFISGSRYKSSTTSCDKSKTNTHNDTFRNDPTYINTKILNCTQGLSPIHPLMRKNINRQKLRSELKTCSTIQRPDLGTIVRFVEKNILEKHAIKNQTEIETDSNDELRHKKDLIKAQSFVGSVNALLFGRKGGWL